MNKISNQFYGEVCPECEGWDLKFSNEEQDGSQLNFTVTCRECGESWNDYINLGG